MAQTSYPESDYNAGALTEAEWERVASRFTDDGVDGNPSQSAVVTAGVGLQVLVAAETYASVRGFTWYSGTTAVPLTISANASGQPRVDWVCLRLDRSTWEVRAVVKEGTPGSGSPSLIRTSDGTVWELPLALVSVPNGAASVTVTRYEQYIGSRIAPCTSTTRPVLPRRGDQIHETDTGRWLGWDGSAWRVIYEDSGDITLSGSFSAWEQRDPCVGRRMGNVVSLRLSYRRVNITFGSTDADGSRVAILPSTLRPTDRHQYATALFGNGALSVVRVQTDGEVWLETPTKNVEANRVFRLTVTYLK